MNNNNYNDNITFENYNVKLKTIEEKFEFVLREGNETNAIDKASVELKKLILLEGIPIESEERQELPETACLRGKIWKALLKVSVKDSHYLEMLETIQKDRETQNYMSRLHDKIKVDIDRTLKQELFFQKESIHKIVLRILMVLAYEYYMDHFEEIQEQNNTELTSGYTQGMTAIVFHFIFLMPEIDAYFCCSKIWKKMIPTYLRASELNGCYDSLILLFSIIKNCDTELYNKLTANKHIVNGSFFKLMQALWSLNSAPPFSESLKLWDFHLAFGLHFNISTTAARLLLIRDKLINSKNPYQHLNHSGNDSLPDLESQYITSLSYKLCWRMSEEEYQLLLRHAIDESFNITDYSNLDSDLVDLLVDLRENAKILQQNS
eukprot:TRINITY_DN572_c1_g1_i1.p1 TRINITY_DN572_c1_g1~~TRINITY_DN572_c1_g1_i1.p1  ORF type:complete len:378 (-),score=84.29 TRINITY_DN572_c1_g1_i1:108-1241(-)